MTDGGVARTGLDLGGVGPPAYSSDPTVVVWREYGRFRDRVPLMVTCYVLYAAVAVFVELIGPHRLLGAFPHIFDAACFVVAALQGLAMTSPHAYTAEGATWLARKYGGRNPNRGRYRTMKLPEVVRVDAVKRYGALGMGKTTVVRFLRADERGIFIDLKALQCCSPLVAVIDRALPDDRVEFQSGLRQAIHRHPPAGARQVGTTIVREEL